MLAADLNDHGFHDEDDHQHVEEHPRLHDAGQAVGREDRQAEDPVLEDEEAEDVAERIAPGDAEREPISAIANARGMAPSVGSSTDEVTGSMMT